jgi:hypothetical protein
MGQLFYLLRVNAEAARRGERLTAELEQDSPIF